jgi:hypothetical protein
VRGNGIGHVRIDYARLNDHALIRNINLENPIHPREADHDPTLSGQSASAKSSSRSTRDKWYAMPGTDPNYRLHLFSSARQHHGARHSVKIRETVALVRLELAGSRNQSTWPPWTASIQRISQGIDNG